MACIIVFVDLGHPSNSMPHVCRPLAPSILPGNPLLAVLRPVSLEVAAAASVVGVVPMPLIVCHL
jgi:hypothetical protein